MYPISFGADSTLTHQLQFFDFKLVQRLMAVSHGPVNHSSTGNRWMPGCCIDACTRKQIAVKFGDLPWNPVILRFNFCSVAAVYRHRQTQNRFIRKRGTDIRPMKILIMLGNFLTVEIDSVAYRPFSNKVQSAVNIRSPGNTLFVASDLINLKQTTAAICRIIGPRCGKIIRLSKIVPESI